MISIISLDKTKLFRLLYFKQDETISSVTTNSAETKMKESTNAISSKEEVGVLASSQMEGIYGTFQVHKHQIFW